MSDKPVVLKLSAEQAHQLMNKLKNFAVEPIAHTQFRAKYQNHTITLYNSLKLMIQGQKANQIANNLGFKTIAIDGPSKNTSKSTSKSTSKNSSKGTSVSPLVAKSNTIGSDENGNGSYFGSLTVCATYVSQDVISRLQQLGVKDSKMLTDSKILSLSPILKDLLPYELYELVPERYNALQKQYNQHQLKAIIHNFVITELLDRLSASNHVDHIIIDQFEPAANYFKHLNGQTRITRKNIIITPKAESKSLAVAAASIIARSAFLKSLSTLGKPYNIQLPSGASHKSDVVAANIYQKFGLEGLEQTAKLHFANTNKAIALATTKGAN